MLLEYLRIFNLYAKYNIILCKKVFINKQYTYFNTLLFEESTKPYILEEIYGQLYKQIILEMWLYFLLNTSSFYMSVRRHDYHPSHASRYLVEEQKNENIHTEPNVRFHFRNWKTNFFQRPENHWLCDIPNEFIADSFNTYGLQNGFSYYHTCLQIILGKPTISEASSNTLREIEQNLPILYGLIHARFIMSPDGIRSVRAKYQSQDYGRCPRVNCKFQQLLPFGPSSTYGHSKAKNFCPCCREIYEPRPQVNLDGSFFGPNMVHIFVDELAKSQGSYPFHFLPFQHDAFGFRIRNENFKTVNETHE